MFLVERLQDSNLRMPAAARLRSHIFRFAQRTLRVQGHRFEPPDIKNIPLRKERYVSGGRYRTRTCDLPHVKRMLIPAELIVRIFQGKGYYTKDNTPCQLFFALFFGKICVDQPGLAEGLA